MACGSDITYQPIVGGYDPRTPQGAVAPADFELVFNMDGGLSSGYSRLAGWTRYRHADACGDPPVLGGPPGPVYAENGNYKNQDLHDQMAIGSSIAGNYPVDVTGSVPGPSVTWYSFQTQFSTNQLALLLGKVELWVSYNSAAGNGEAVGRTAVTVPSINPNTIGLVVNMPGDASNIRVRRIIGDQVAPLVRSGSTVPAGPGFVIDDFPPLMVDGNECVPYSQTPNSQISLLTSAISVSGRRRIIAATRSVIYCNDDHSGNWRILADGLGGYCQTGAQGRDTTVSFKMVQLGNFCLFTNGFDPVLFWKFDEPPAGPRNWSADYLLELQALRIQAAKVIAKHDGFVLIGNVLADGRYETSRLYWSEYNDPMSWIPGGESAAGYHDFGRGEAIVAVASIGGKLRVYTDQAVYDGTVVEDSRIWAFTELYRADQGERLIRYPNSFVNTGAAHLWIGSDSIYLMEAYDRTPRRQEWIHRAAGAIFLGVPAARFDGIPNAPAGFLPIDRKRCEQPVGGYDPIRETVWFSWPTSDSLTNNISLAVWPAYGKASVVDQGFTAFGAHKPDTRISTRDWIGERGVCDPNQQLLPKEGMTCDLSDNFRTFPFFINPGEDIYGAIHPDSALATMCGFCTETLCRTCDSDVRFLMATVDQGELNISIKELVPDSCVRHRLVGRMLRAWPNTSQECHDRYGYLSVLQQGASKLGENGNKTLNGITLQVSSPEQSPAGTLNAQIGTGDIPSGILWGYPDSQPLGESDPEPPCFTDDAQPGDPECARPLAPRYDYPYDFVFYEAGEYVAWRVFVDGIGSCFTVTGASLRVDFSSRCK